MSLVVKGRELDEAVLEKVGSGLQGGLTRKEERSKKASWSPLWISETRSNPWRLASWQAGSSVFVARFGRFEHVFSTPKDESGLALSKLHQPHRFCSIFSAFEALARRKK